MREASWIETNGSNILTEPVLFADVVSEQQDQDSTILVLAIPPDLHYFDGHFTNAPVLPGVVMTHWAVEYIEANFQTDLARFDGLQGLKFQSIVRPGYQLTLELKRIDNTKFSFSYRSEHGQHASGKVLFK